MREAAALCTRRRCARETGAVDVMGFCMMDPLHTPRQTCSAMGFPGKTMDNAFNDEIEATRPYDWCHHTCHPPALGLLRRHLHACHPATLPPYHPATLPPCHPATMPPCHESCSPLPPGLQPHKPQASNPIRVPRCGTNNYIAFWCSVAGGNGHMPGPHIGRNCETGTEWDGVAKLCQVCHALLVRPHVLVCMRPVAPKVRPDMPGHCLLHVRRHARCTRTAS